jgi:HAD superfamily hydrolase (TIGR01509 family)
MVEGIFMPHAVKAVVFDWGETLVLVPNMVTSVERHIACLEQIYFDPGDNGRLTLSDYGVPWPCFREAYEEATRAHIRRSRKTQREHRFEDRFVHALKLAGATREPKASDLAHLVAPFGKNIVREAELIDGADEVIPELAKRMRLGVVSNYPHYPVVNETLERFGLRQYFSTIVVSGEFGWLKPHPDIYRQALSQIEARPQETVFVGDDLDNDVVGPKALGLRTVWFTRQAVTSVHADTKISDLRELLSWVGPCSK